MMKRLILGFAVIALLLGDLTEQTWAGQITVANYSFEDPALAAHTYTSNLVPGWTGTGTFGVSYGDSVPSLLDPAPDGNQEAYLNGTSSLFQDLGVSVISGDRYVLDLFVGGPIQTNSVWQVEILAGLVQFGSANGVISGTGDYYPIQILAVGVGSGDLGIRLSETAGGVQVVYDDVRLMDNGPAAVPVPSTLVMSSILFGMFAAIWSYRRLTQTAMPWQPLE